MSDNLNVEEAKEAALLNVYDAFTDPTAAMLAPKGMLIPATLHMGKILTGKLGTLAACTYRLLHSCPLVALLDPSANINYYK